MPMVRPVISAASVCAAFNLICDDPGAHLETCDSLSHFMPIIEAVAFPTDVKLTRRARERLARFATKYGLTPCHPYARVGRGR